MPLVAHASRSFVMAPVPGRVPQVRMAVGEVETFAFDLTELSAGGDGASGIPAWSSSATGVATTGGEALTGGVTALCNVTAAAEGDALVTCTVTLSSSRVYKRSVAIHVRSPL